MTVKITSRTTDGDGNLIHLMAATEDRNTTVSIREDSIHFTVFDHKTPFSINCMSRLTVYDLNAFGELVQFARDIRATEFKK